MWVCIQFLTTYSGFVLRLLECFKWPSSGKLYDNWKLMCSYLQSLDNVLGQRCLMLLFQKTSISPTSAIWVYSTTADHNMVNTEQQSFLDNSSNEWVKTRKWIRYWTYSFSERCQQNLHKGVLRAGEVPCFLMREPDEPELNPGFSTYWVWIDLIYYRLFWKDTRTLLETETF